jgi:hypothetical protein
LFQGEALRKLPDVEPGIAGKTGMNIVQVAPDKGAEGTRFFTAVREPPGKSKAENWD